MVDMNKLLGSFLSSGAGTGFAGGLAGGFVSKMITGKSVKKLGSGALKLGGVAAVGALAYTAYQRYNNSQGAAAAETPVVNAAVLKSPPAGSAFLPAADDQAANDRLGLMLIRAMIAAARADGRMDAQESQVIFQRIESLGLDNASQNVLVQEMGHPFDMDAIVNSATSPEVASEIYIASLLAIDVDTAAEKAYLAMLAARLQLPPQLVTELDSQVLALKM